MSTVPTVIDVDEWSFQREVVERSRSVPVVIDFWAEWCAPCRALSPVLERLAAEADGAWVLAKIDVDRNPNLAAAFGVQGIPAVKAVKDGRVVAEFTGALPEAQVRQWLRALGPSEGEREAAAGRAAEERGDLEAAAAHYRRALALEPANDEARSGLSRVELALRARTPVDEQELRSRLEADPSDAAAATALADTLAARGDFGSAFEVLLGCIRASSGEARERARVRYVELLDALGPEDPRVAEARRALSAALF